VGIVPFPDSATGDATFNTIVIGADKGYEFKDVPVKVRGAISTKYDVKEAPGTDGASVVNRGYTPWKGTVTFTIWTADHWETYQALIPQIQPTPGKTATRVIAVFHPLLAMHKLLSFNVENVGIGEWTSKGYDVELSLIQYFEKPKAVAKPKPPASIEGVPVAAALKPKKPSADPNSGKP
jgi:hypothetical protein